MGHSEKHLDFYNNDIGKKVFTIEEEVTTVVKWQVKAKDSDEAFEKWLNCDDTSNCESYEVKDNGTDIVNHFTKDYGGYQDTKLVGEVTQERAFPDDDEDDTMDYKVEYGTSV